MVITVDAAILFKVIVILSKDFWTYGTGEVFHVELVIKSCDVRASDGPVAFPANQIQALKVVVFAVNLCLAIGVCDGEELVSNDVVAVLGHQQDTLQRKHSRW